MGGAGVVSVIAIVFVSTAKNVDFISWQDKLNFVEMLYYTVLIILAWIMSFRLFATIVVLAVAIYAALQQPLKDLDFYNPDKKCGLKSLFGSLSASMGFGFYFLIAVGMILYSDYHAFRIYHIELGAYTQRWTIVGITIILTIVYYSILLLTYIELNKKLKMIVKEQLNENKSLSNQKTNLLRDISITPIVSANDICVFFFSVLFPGLAAVVQLILPFT